MEGQGEEGRPRRELSTESSWYKPGMSHEQRVKVAQGYIKQRQHLHAGAYSPEEIIRSGLDLESRSRHSDDEKIDKEKRDSFHQLGYAWDALAYDHYEPGSSSDHFALTNLSSYYQHSCVTGEKPTIKLNPVQVQIIDALTEAVGIPHKKGQAEIEIPEKLRSETKWLLSEEYHERLVKAAARARGEKPERASQELKLKSTEQGGVHKEGAANTPLVFFMKQEVFDKLRSTPDKAERAVLPIEIMSHMKYLIGMREYKSGHEKELGEKLAPYRQSIQKLEMAYEIIAYDLLQQTGNALSTNELIRDAQMYPNKDVQEHPNRAPIELNDEELRILGSLAKIMELPLNPEKHVYSYLELSAKRDVYGKLAMDSYMARQAHQNAINEGILKERSAIEKEIRRRFIKPVPSSSKSSDPQK